MSRTTSTTSITVNEFHPDAPDAVEVAVEVQAVLEQGFPMRAELYDFFTPEDAEHLQDPDYQWGEDESADGDEDDEDGDQEPEGAYSYFADAKAAVADGQSMPFRLFYTGHSTRKSASQILVEPISHPSVPGAVLNSYTATWQACRGQRLLSGLWQHVTGLHPKGFLEIERDDSSAEATLRAAMWEHLGVQQLKDVVTVGFDHKNHVTKTVLCAYTLCCWGFTDQELEAIDLDDLYYGEGGIVRVNYGADEETANWLRLSNL